MKFKQSFAVGLSACQFQLQPGARELQLLPAGPFRAIDGRPGDVPGGSWHIDAALAQRLIDAVHARANPFVIDYEHQTLNAEKNGQAAPAAGWWDAKSMVWREGQGLFATDVTWTARASSAIAALEYKFFSPVFKYDRKTGAVTDILMGAVTNYAGIDGMEALAARAATLNPSDKSDQENETMKELLKLLGLKDDATEAEAVAALSAIIKSKSDAETAIAAAKAEAQTPDPAKFVPVETMKTLQTDIATLRADLTNRDVSETIEAALAAGKLLPAQEPWARGLGKTNLAALKSYIDTAQPIAALRRTQTDGKGPKGDLAGELDETALAVCKQLSLDPEAYKKTLAA